MGKVLAREVGRILQKKWHTPGDTRPRVVPTGVDSGRGRRIEGTIGVFQLSVVL
ncbi:hypothetical protein BGY98DRAFT_998956 [Russula aff. rugulosa BPL654]|nr:hypothetical protein BGY98DRAFT_998956 [Russula aff. rugulosa BPL654]